MKLKDIVEELTKDKYLRMANKAFEESRGEKLTKEKMYKKILNNANNKEDVKENKEEVMTAIRNVLKDRSKVKR